MSTPRLLARNTAVVLLALVLAAGAVYLFIAHPGVFKTVALWLVGLAGFVFAGFRKLLGFLSSDGKLDDLQAKNDQLKKDAERLQLEMEEAGRLLQDERAYYEKEIADLSQALLRQREEYQTAQSQLEQIKRMSYREYYESLPKEEQRRIEEQMFEGVVFQ